MVVGVEVAEDLEAFLRREIDSHGSCLHRLLDGGRHPLEPPDPVEQHGVLPSEVGGRIGSAIGHDVLDLVQSEPELAVEQDALQPIEIGVRVPAVAGVGPAAGAQQPDLVVMVQRPHGHAGEPGDRAHREAHLVRPSTRP